MFFDCKRSYDYSKDYLRQLKGKTTIVYEEDYVPDNHDFINLLNFYSTKSAKKIDDRL